MDAVKKREFILPRLFEFVRKHNMTLLLISHEVPLMKEMDHVFVLSNGKLACQGSHEELIKSGAAEYRRLVGCTEHF